MQTKEVSVNVPDIATKQIKTRTVNDQTRITLSSNWLLLFGFDENTRVIETSLGLGKGIEVRIATPHDIDAKRTKKVYTRTYTSRSTNILNPPAKRTERQIEIASQRLILDSMGNCEHVHVTFSQGLVIFRPVHKAKYELIQSLGSDEQINTLVAMTGGVDAHVLESQGFNISAIVEYRPKEKRDKSDYTETTCLNALVNSSPNVLINEDIYSLDPDRLATVLTGTPITVAHFSLPCTELSSLKTNKLKQASLDEVSSTLDAFIPMLNIVTKLRCPVVVIENVANMRKHPINDLICLQLARRGFTTHQGIFDARQYGGLTSRKRLYMVATALQGEFKFPTPTSYTRNVWKEVIEPNLDSILEMDVTETSVMQTALKVGRARIISEDKAFSPCLVRSQGQDTKDAVVVKHKDRYYRLPLHVQQQLNCIGNSFNLDWIAKDKGSQIIGQSICASLHDRIMESVQKHILSYAQNRIVSA